MGANVTFLEVLKVEDSIAKCLLQPSFLRFAETALSSTECYLRPFLLWFAETVPLSIECDLHHLCPLYSSLHILVYKDYYYKALTSYNLRTSIVGI